MAGGATLSGKYTAYPEYKSSEIDWSDVLPSDWGRVSLRWISTMYAGGTPSKNIEEYWEDGTVPWLNSGAVNQRLVTEASTFITQDAFKNSSAKWIPKNALVMALAGQGKTKGMVAQLGIDTTCNQSMAAIVPDALSDSRFLFWWLTKNYQNIRNMSGGDNRDGLNLELLGNIECPIPSNEEKEKIANFLDHETAKIDTLIDKQQQLITLLKEKRQAVISHAVTKGLNSEAPMRDSGVESIGIMPEHWTLKSLSLASKKLAVGLAMSVTDSYEEEGVPIIRNQNIKEGYFDGGDMLYLNPDFAEAQASKKVRAGDVVIVRTGSNVGLTCCVPDEYDQCHTFTTLIVTPSDELVKEYFTYCMNSAYGKAEVNRLKFGFGKDNLNVGELRSMHALLPSVDEQKEIVSHLEQEVDKIELIIKKANIAIGLMQERRTALISAAVTGKIDVRNWQTSAPSNNNKEVAA
jgi:type I restriction enzyme S subunit